MKNNALLQLNPLQINKLAIAEDIKPDVDTPHILSQSNRETAVHERYSGISIDIAKERFVAYLRDTGRAIITIANYERTLTYFYHFLKEKGIDIISGITSEVIYEYQDYIYKAHDKAEETLRFYIKDIKRFLDYLIKMGLTYGNPALEVKVREKTIETAEVITRYYSVEEIVRKYRHFLKDKGISFSFFEHERVNINTFLYFMTKQNVNSVYKVSKSLIEEYKEHLNSHEYNDGKGLNMHDQIEKLRSLRRFYKWLIKTKMHKFNPTTHLKIGEYERYLKRHGKKASKPVVTPAKTQIQQYIETFLDYKNSRGLSQRTIERSRMELKIFIGYLKTKNITEVQAVKKEVMLSYLNYLSSTYKTKSGRFFSQSTKSNLMGIVKNFFQFLVRFEYLKKDPTIYIDSLKPDDGIPRTLMTPKEVYTLLTMPNVTKPMGIRDKAMLETLYSTGMRASELTHLKLDDIDFTQGLVRINYPKGGRPQQRIIPIGKIALNCITEYVGQARQYLLNGSPDILFLSKTGKMLTHDDVCNMVKGYVFKARFKKNITTHSFRVTCATEMLKNRADIRYVQQQLGHKKITSTQRYTRVIPIDLKIVHSQTHPREKQVFQ